MYDLVIIGGGPAGVSAAIYSARKQLKTALITKDFGGQSVVSPAIENWIGETQISGIDLSKKLESHAEKYEGEFLDIKKGLMVEKVAKNQDGTFNIFTKSAKEEVELQTKTVLVASGSKRKKLEALKADEFENKGVTYCATCDGPIFKDKDVAVIGGGNAAFETAAQLLAYCNSVTMINRAAKPKADAITVNSLKKNSKLKLINNAEVTEIFGEFLVSGLEYKKNDSGEIEKIAVSGIFVEIGAIPAVSFVSNLVEMNEIGAIKIDPWNQKTSEDGIWAAGDCTNILYHQNNIASGDAIRALEDIYLWITNHKS